MPLNTFALDLEDEKKEQGFEASEYPAKITPDDFSLEDFAPVKPGDFSLEDFQKPFPNIKISPYERLTPGGQRMPNAEGLTSDFAAAFVPPVFGAPQRAFNYAMHKAGQGFSVLANNLRDPENYRIDPTIDYGGPIAEPGKPIGGPLPLSAPGNVGIIPSLSRAFDALRTPEMIATAPFAASKLVQAGFLMDTAAAVPDTVQNIAEAWKAKNPDALAGGITDATVQTLIAMGLGHGLKRGADYALQRETAQAIRDVRPQPREGASEVPTPESSAETGLRGGEGAEAAKNEQERLLLKSQAEDHVRAARESGDGFRIKKALRDQKLVEDYLADWAARDHKWFNAGLSAAEIENTERQFNDAAKEVGDTLDILHEFTDERGEPFVDQPGRGVVGRPTATGSQWLRGPLLRMVASVPARQRPALIRSMVLEERFHRFVTDEQALDYLRSLSDVERRINYRIYTGYWTPEKLLAASKGAPIFSDTQLGHEAIRRRMEKLLTGSTREVIQAAFKEKWTVRGLDILANFIRDLRESGKIRGYGKILGTEEYYGKPAQAILDDVSAKLEVAKQALVRGRAGTEVATGEVQGPEQPISGPTPVSAHQATDFEQWRADELARRGVPSPLPPSPTPPPEAGGGTLPWVWNQPRGIPEWERTETLRKFQEQKESLMERFMVAAKKVSPTERQRLTSDSRIARGEGLSKKEIASLPPNLREIYEIQKGLNAIVDSPINRQLLAIRSSGTGSPNPSELETTGFWQEGTKGAQPGLDAIASQLAGMVPIRPKTTLDLGPNVYKFPEWSGQTKHLQEYVAERNQLINRFMSGIHELSLEDKKRAKADARIANSYIPEAELKKMSPGLREIHELGLKLNEIARDPRFAQLQKITDAGYGGTHQAVGSDLGPNVFKAPGGEQPELPEQKKPIEGQILPPKPPVPQLPLAPQEKPLTGGAFTPPPAKAIEEAASRMIEGGIASGKMPRFSTFRKTIGVKKEVLFYPWMDAATKQLLTAKGENLRALLRDMHLLPDVAEALKPSEERPYLGIIPDAPTEPGALEEQIGQVEMFQQFRKKPKSSKTIEEGQQRRLAAIGAILDTLAKRAGGRPKGITFKKEFGPEDVATRYVVIQPSTPLTEGGEPTGEFTQPEVESRRLFHRLTDEQAKDPILVGKLATEAARTDVGKRSLTRGLLALRDKISDRIILVSAYRHQRKGPVVTNPAGAGADIRIDNALLSRYDPMYTILAREPLEDFRQVFKNESDFQHWFGDLAVEGTPGVPSSSFTGQMAGVAREQAGIVRGRGTPPPEAETLRGALAGQEPPTGRELTLPRFARKTVLREPLQLPEHLEAPKPPPGPAMLSAEEQAKLDARIKAESEYQPTVVKPSPELMKRGIQIAPGARGERVPPTEIGFGRFRKPVRKGVPEKPPYSFKDPEKNRELERQWEDYRDKLEQPGLLKYAVNVRHPDGIQEFVAVPVGADRVSGTLGWADLFTREDADKMANQLRGRRGFPDVRVAKSPRPYEPSPEDSPEVAEYLQKNIYTVEWGKPIDWHTGWEEPLERQLRVARDKSGNIILASAGGPTSEYHTRLGRQFGYAGSGHGPETDFLPLPNQKYPQAGLFGEEYPYTFNPEKDRRESDALKELSAGAVKQWASDLRDLPSDYLEMLLRQHEERDISKWSSVQQKMHKFRLDALRAEVKRRGEQSFPAVFSAKALAQEGIEYAADHARDWTLGLRMTQDMSAKLDDIGNRRNTEALQAEMDIRMASMNKPPLKDALKFWRQSWTHGNREVLAAANAIVEAEFNQSKLQDFRDHLNIAEQNAQTMAQSTKFRERQLAKAYMRDIAASRAEIEYADAHWNDRNLQATAKRAKKTLDRQVALERANGINVRRQGGYVPHRLVDVWGEDTLFSLPGVLGTKFTVPRVFRDHYAALEAGPYMRVTHDIASLVHHRVRQGLGKIYRDLWKAGLSTIEVRPGIPLAMDPHMVGTRPVSPHTNYQIIPTENFGYLAIHKSMAASMKNLLSPSWVDSSPKVRRLLHWEQKLKHTLLIGDFFHFARMLYYGTSMLGKQAWRSPQNIGKFGWSALDIPLANIPEAVSKGLITQREADWANAQIPGTGYTRRELLKQAYSHYGANIGRISDALYKDLVTDLTPTAGWMRRQWVRATDPTVGRYNRFLFDKMTRGLMAESIVRQFEKQWKPPTGTMQRTATGTTSIQSGGTDFDVLLRDVTRDVNERFGNLGRQGMLKSKTAQDLARLFFLAPQWVEGMARTEARAIGRWTGAAQAAAHGEAALTGIPAPPGFGKRRGGIGGLGTTGASMGKAMVGMFVLTQAINLLTRGKPTWKNEEEGHGMDAWIPPLFDDEGEGFWFSPMALFMEVSHDLYRLSETRHQRGQELAGTITQIAANKLSPVARGLLVFGSGTTPLGERITGTVDRALWEPLKAAAPVPITFGRWTQGIGHVGASLVGHPEAISPPPRGSIQRQAAGTIGLKIEPAQSKQALIGRMADQFMRETGLQKESGWVQVQTDQPNYSKLRRAIRNGDDKQATKLFEGLLKTHSEADINKAMKLQMHRPFTGNMEAESVFVKSLSPEELQVYQEARARMIDDYLDYVGWITKQR